MAQKIAIHVVLTVDLVIHGCLAVEMGNAMVEKIACLVHQIVALVIHIRIHVAMANATAMKQNGLVHKIVAPPIIVVMAIVCPIWVKIQEPVHKIVVIAVEMVYVGQVRPATVVHKIVACVLHHIHVQTQMIHFLEPRVNMLNQRWSALALQVLHRRLHKLLVELLLIHTPIALHGLLHPLERRLQHDLELVHQHKLQHKLLHQHQLL
jgi:hypothetical protein